MPQPLLIDVAMLRFARRAGIALLLSGSCSAATGTGTAPATSPNVVFFLIDDYGQLQPCRLRARPQRLKFVLCLMHRHCAKNTHTFRFTLRSRRTHHGHIKPCRKGYRAQP